MTRLLSITALALVSLVATAGAEPRSWAAAKALVPDGATVIAGGNLTSMRATQLYQTLVPPLLDKQADARMAFDLANATCGIDLHTAVDDATIVMTDDERGVIVLGLGKGLDQQKLVGCFSRLLVKLAKDKRGGGASTGLRAGVTAKQRQAPAPKLAIKTTGRITEYAVAGEPKKLYLAWLAADVVAVATEPDDRDLLARMLGGKGARGSLAGAVGKVNTGATVWFATTKQGPMQGNGTMKVMFGTIDATGGRVRVDTHAIMGSAKEAKKLVDDATALIKSVKPQVPPQFTKVVEALRLTAAGNDAMMKLALTEKDLITILDLVMSSL